MTEAVRPTGSATERLRAARDFLLETREDYDRAYREFRWPQLETFKWALDWFDVLAAEDGGRRALWIVEEDGSERACTFAELSARSNRVANWLREQGVARGDRIIVMLGNRVELWETILAAMKLGAVIIPATPLLTPADLVDRVERGDARFVVAESGHVGKFDGVPGSYARLAVGERVDGWQPYAEAESADEAFTPDGATAASDPLLLYFTSGTTAKPKLVEHSHASYPLGADVGEVSLDLGRRPLGLMTGYRHPGEGAAADAVAGSHYRSGDVASRDADGYITSIGRADDVFKASDYRISPFELESVLIEHDAVAEAAVVPSPDPLRLAVPKAYVTLTAGHEPTRETALSIMRYTREQLAPYKRIRRLEFGALPKTISGKIRRVELGTEEHARHPGETPGDRAEREFWEDDFPELRA